jgi:hypothetical protein
MSARTQNRCTTPHFDPSTHHREKLMDGELALEIHAQIEEEIFYPKAREATKDNDLIDESLVEHATVKSLISEIEEMEVGDDLYDAKIRVLGEMVKHHIHEEEGELFPELESAKIDLEAVGKELTERKEALLAEMQA